MTWFKRKQRVSVPSPVSPPRRPRMFIPQSVLAETERLLASAHEHEQVVYWAGVEGPGVSAVLTCIAPEAATTIGSFDTSAASNAVVINWIAQHGLVHLAQLHCHPDHRVGHSDGDDRGALMPFENFVSIVVPHYGNAGIGAFEHSGVHRYEGRRFVRLTKDEVAATLTVVPGSANFRGGDHADLA